MTVNLISDRCRSVMLERLERFPGEFEFHITASLLSNQTAEFRQVCESLGAKAIIIDLTQGATPTQPMLCGVSSGKPEDVFKTMRKFESELSKSFKIIRIKIEASLKNKGIPKNEIEYDNEDCYFEHHVKIKLDPNMDLDQLALELKSFDAHLSHNAISRDSCFHEYFATQRVKGFGLNEALVQFQKLNSFFESEGIPMTKSIREYNIFDSDINVDAGWMAK